MLLSEQIERFRRKLLDLTNRNRLLNLRRGSRTVAIVDEMPDQIYQRLVPSQKPFMFVPAAEPGVAGVQSLYGVELPIPGEGSRPTSARHRDDKLQTQLDADKLSRVLAAIRTDANSVIQETGINHLFLALGLLRWFESRTSDRFHDAPLLLIPVQLEREYSERERRYVFPLRWSGEEVQSNPCLQLKLDREFGLRLPEFDEQEQTPDTYLASVRLSVTSEPRWQVRREALLGFFSFTKLLMYRDLDSGAWPADAGPEHHALLKQLFGGGGVSEEAGDRPAIFARDYEIDERTDAPEIELVDNADSSQHSALIDIALGKTMVIEGPPGTGKSQTITNAIGSALAAGKTVLFVSEKLAALEVVKTRLTTLGLGQLCLELHSNKAKSKDVYDDLRLRLETRFDPPFALAHEQVQLRARQEQLQAYLRATEVKVGPSQEPLYEVFWKVVELRGRGLTVLSEASVNLQWNHAHFQDRLALFETVRRHVNEIGAPQQHPWRAYHCPKLRLHDRDVVSRALASLHSAMSVLETETRLLAEHSKVHWPLLPGSGAPNLDGSLVPPEPFAQHTAASVLKDPSAAKNVAELLEWVTAYPHERERAQAVCRTGDFREHTSAAKRCLEGISRWFARSPDTSIAQLGEMEVLVGNANRALTEVEGIAAELQRLGHGQVRNPREYLAAADRHRLMTDSAIGDGSQLVPEHFYANAPRAAAELRARAATLLLERDALERVFAVGDVPPGIDLAETRRVLRQHGGSWMRWASSAYRAAKRSVRAFLKPGARVRPLQLADDLARLEEHIRKSAEFDQDRKARQFGPLFAGLGTDWDALERTMRWAEQSRAIGVGFDEAKRLLKLIREAEQQPLAEGARDAAKQLNAQLSAGLLKSLFADLHDRGPAVPLSEVRARLDHLGQGLLDLRQTLNTFEFGAATSLGDVQRALQSVEAAARLRERADGDTRLCQLLGPDFAGVQTEVEPLTRALEWTRRLAQMKLPPAVTAWLTHKDLRGRAAILQERLTTARGAIAQWQQAMAQLNQYGLIDEEWLLGRHDTPDDGVGPHQRCLQRLEPLMASTDRLAPWSDWCRTIDRGTQLECAAFVQAVTSGAVAADQIGAVFELTFFDALAQQAIAKSDVLAGFSRQQLEQAREQYQLLDQRLLQLNRRRIAYQCSTRPVPRGIGSGRVSELTELSLIRHEINKQHRHCRIRQLIERAGTAVQGLKPCFMMSPLSVAHFLSPGSITFDLVIMDEASQVKPEDALGAIARGQQVVVVGDPKQLPPTSFWDKVDDEEIPDDEQTIADETESILEVSMKAFPNPRRLKWHYRSRHESLIAFSNERFYDGDLVVFPSPARDAYGIGGEGRLGVRFHRVSGGLYRPKQGNLVEAQAVADAVVRHALESPEVSLGVGTFNIHQRDLIERCLDERCSQDSRVREAVDALRHREEGLFVKNLENLQGDERDVIFISYTFGPEQDGGRVMQRFGPIAQSTGWRRLNVLITRGRQRVEVFSSIDPEGIIGGPDRSVGVNSMKDYLEFAARGKPIDRGEATGREPESPFEISVMRAVERQGLKVVPQVGVAGYFIDIGVLRPGRDDEFLLGIECDGASYHSAKSTRDRDCLREQVIRDRGWNLHRIWSTDWYYNQQSEELRLGQVIKQAISPKP